MSPSVNTYSLPYDAIVKSLQRKPHVEVGVITLKSYHVISSKFVTFLTTHEKKH